MDVGVWAFLVNPKPKIWAMRLGSPSEELGQLNPEPQMSARSLCLKGLGSQRWKTTLQINLVRQCSSMIHMVSSMRLIPGSTS